MEPRVVLQIRLSRRWVEGSPQSVESLAYYLYNLYSFLGLADPSALFGWAIAQDRLSGGPYLILIENPEGPSGPKGPWTGPRKISILDSSTEIEPLPEELLNEDELDPNL